jgi:hypothetical protein
MKGYLRNPIALAAATFAAIFAAAFCVAPPALVNDVLDGFVVAASGLALWRFGCHAREALGARRPDGPQTLIVGMAGTVASVGALRLLRELALDLGDSPLVGYAFGGITVAMAFSIFLLVVAPPIHHAGQKLNLSPWSALVIALLSGSAVSAAFVAARFLPP